MELKREDFDNGLMWLFSFTAKADIEQASKSLVLTQRDLADAIFFAKLTSDVISHKSVFRTIHPMHLALTERDRRAFDGVVPGPHTPGTKKVANKIVAMFNERRHLAAHLFWLPDTMNWWLLHFSGRDVNFRDSHWDEGAHVHLLCRATHPRQNPGEYLDHVRNAEKPRLPSGIHLRYRQEDDR